jgi:hypothetical protein
MNIPAEIRRWLYLAALIVGLCLAFAVLTMCHDRDRSADVIKTERETTRQLDNVTRQTDEIRTDQKEKQDAVNQIEGSSDRLPDGYGARLECVRRGECRNP